MSPLLAPLLAQVVALSVSDRTEVRHIREDEKYYEGSTSPTVALTSTWRRSGVVVAYSPSFLLTPLERQERQLEVYHEASIGGSYRWKRSQLTLSSSLGWGSMNFRLQALRPATAPPANPMQGGGTDTGGTDTGDTGDGGAQPGEGAQPSAPPTGPEITPPTNDQPNIVDHFVRYLNSTTNLDLTHDVSRDLQVSGSASYSYAGGMDAEAREDYPIISGWVVGAKAAYLYRLKKRDFFTTSALLQHGWASDGSKVGSLLADEGWLHVFDPRTTMSLRAGVSITRFSQENGLAGFSVFPAFLASFWRSSRLGRGELTMSVFAYSAPSLDPLRALVDPRVGFGAFLNYTRDRFFANVGGSTALSLAPVDSNSGAIDAAQAQASAGYQLADRVSIDGGVRYNRQNTQDLVVIPSSWAGFVGLSLGYEYVLSGRRP